KFDTKVLDTLLPAINIIIVISNSSKLVDVKVLLKIDFGKVEILAKSKFWQSQDFGKVRILSKSEFCQSRDFGEVGIREVGILIKLEFCQS
ncbi:12028_t:CDS:2, partial [Dentiscutata heterogama]